MEERKGDVVKYLVENGKTDMTQFDQVLTCACYVDASMKI